MNSYQTIFTEEDFKNLPKEVKSEFYDVLDNIQFVKWLVADENIRGYAKNKKRWDFPNDLENRKENTKGKIYVDITKPHILEGLDFFRERALFFDKHGKYTDIPISPNPKSTYADFWREELRRWKDGLVRPSDGEWIPGGLYFYWNYCPIWLVEKENSNIRVTGKKSKGSRVRKFPHPWLGDYLFYHYIEQARDNGQHCKMLKCRGIGASFKMGSMSPRNMFVYPGSGNPNFHLASDKTFLQGDKGVFGKVIDTLDWVADHTPMPKLRLGDSKRAMEVQLGYLDEYGVRRGLLSSVYGISLKDNPDKARGIRGPFVHYEEDGCFNHLEDAWNINRKSVEDGDVASGQMISLGCVCKGTKIWTKNFKLKNIEDINIEDGIVGYDIENQKIISQNILNINPPAKKQCVRIHTHYRTLECSIDHPILIRVHHSKRLTHWKEGNLRDHWYTQEWKEAGKLKPKDVIFTTNGINIWGTKTLFDSRLVGMLIGDGSYGMRRHYDKIEFKTPSFSNCDEELMNFVLSKYSCNIELERFTKDGRIYREMSIRDLIPKLKEVGIAGQSKTQKRLPTDYMNLTKQDSALLIAGLFDTDGYIHYREGNTCSISISQGNIEILLELKQLLEKFGILSTITKREPRISPLRKDKNPWYVLKIGSKEGFINFYKNIPLLIKYKQSNVKKIVELGEKTQWRVLNSFNDVIEESIIRVEDIGKQDIYNLTADSSHTYLANNIVTHNTGGVEGANFAGSEKLFYNPSIYNIYGIPNVFDRNANGESVCGFFWGAYLNRNGCYDLVTGEPDVTKALYAILVDRYTVKKGSSDSRAITQKRAEECITPQDSIMRVEGSIFPVADLKDYLSEIMPNIQRFVAPHYVGNFTINDNGDVEFNNSDLVSVIREYPALDNKLGAVEIYEMPRGVDNQRFILGCLPTGEKVMTDVGLMNIENVNLDNKLINESGKLVDINNLQEYNVVDEDIYTIRTANTFRTTTFTKEHPILTSKPKMGYVSIKKWQRLGITQRYLKFDFKYTHVSDVQKGDWLKVPNIYKEVIHVNLNDYWKDADNRIDRLIDNPLWNKDFWWFIGLWLGDGWCASNGYEVNVAFNVNEKFYIQKFENVVNNLFKRKVSKRIRGNGIECKFSFQQLNKFLTDNFGKYAYGKYIPEWAKKVDHELKKQLVLGYIDSDGCIRKDRNGLYAVEIVSINLELVESIQDILFSIGVVSSLSKLRNASNHIIQGKTVKTKETYTLRLAHHDTLNLVQQLNCYEDLKIKRIDFNNLPIVRRNPKYMCFFDENQDYIYFKITDITNNKYTGKVYNFECDTHTFMCSHITTHNCDVYDDDEVGYSDSLGSMIVFDRYTRRIVCEYTGRPQTANAFYEIVYRAARFYNATIMYENNKKGLYAYFNNIKKSLHLLADTPRLITDKQIISPKSNMNNTSKGINATAAINVYGRRLQADWMVEEAYKEKSVVDVIEENIVKETFVPNYRKIRSIGYLKECIAWSSEINTDRISAMNMVMIYDMELTEYGTNTQKQRTKTILDDPFFKRTGGVNYKNKSILQKDWNY